LTSAEQRILEQVRLGLTNDVLAQRLGVSPTSVKYHVANMLSKVGLPDRVALAAWARSDLVRGARRSISSVEATCI
jgi:DNA-binding NarL/FixJ family response regulator